MALNRRAPKGRLPGHTPRSPPPGHAPCVSPVSLEARAPGQLCACMCARGHTPQDRFSGFVTVEKKRKRGSMGVSSVEKMLFPY
jgi:hypothetical protein